MKLDTIRTVDSYTGTLSFDADDLSSAFDEQADPDEQLLYDFTRKWENKPISVRLNILSRIAALIEAKASSLHLTAGDPEPK